MLSIGYARVSTDEQAESLAPQVKRLQDAGCDQVLSDVESGRNSDRDGLLEAMALVKAGKVGELVVTRVDRLGRDAAYADALLAQCEANNVTVRSLDGGQIETATPQGFLMARLQTSLAEMESRMLSLRIRRHLTVYRAEGRHLRRRKPFGYTGGPDHRLMPHPEQWPIALQVLEELRKVGSFSGTAKRLAEWCAWKPAAVNLQAWFVNPVIRGHLPYNLDRKSGKGWNQRWAEIRYDQHPALISEADWRELADMLRRPRNRFPNSANGTEVKHGLTGLLKCASCGHAMRRNSSVGVAWWRCRHRLCNARGGVREEVVFPLVIKACVKEAQRIAEQGSKQQSIDPAVAAMMDELEMMEKLAARNPENRAMAAAVSEQRQQIEAAKRNDLPAPNVDEYAAMAADPVFFTSAPAERQRALFAQVLREVLVGVRADPISPVPRMP